MKNWEFSQIIVNWQHQYGRNNLPWQSNSDPYSTWISEIMLQQTQVKTVIPYFKRFIKNFYNIKILSKSNLNQVLYLWSGLGYYHRAYNIHKTANIIVNKYNGKFPDHVSDLMKLPGIGKTTAHAILSLSHNFTLSILDSNVKRILNRFYNLNNYNINKTKYEKTLWKLINNITPIHHSKKFNQGMMDLGALICSYKKPKCHICPIKSACKYDVYKINANKKVTNIKKNKKLIFYVILQYKKKIILKYRNKNKIWKKLFCFPEFQNLYEMEYWLSKNKIYSIKFKKYYHIKTKFSHFTLKMICIHIFLKKKFLINKKNYLWYHIINKPHVGIPQPINKILIDLTN